MRCQLEQIYADTRASLASYLRYLGLPETAAQETLQEVYLRLYRTLLSGQKIEHMKAWLFRVVHNEGGKVRKQEKKHVAIEPDWERLLSPADSPERILLDKERLLLVRQALSSLSPQQRECLFLRSEGLRYREIADTLGISVSTVNEFLRRALIRLSEAIHV